eukprot:12811078-Ditylum_brightwellii.AAC.1
MGGMNVPAVDIVAFHIIKLNSLIAVHTSGVDYLAVGKPAVLKDKAGEIVDMCKLWAEAVTRRAEEAAQVTAL